MNLEVLFTRIISLMALTIMKINCEDISLKPLLTISINFIFLQLTNGFFRPKNCGVFFLNIPVTFFWSEWPAQLLQIANNYFKAFKSLNVGEAYMFFFNTSTIVSK